MSEGKRAAHLGPERRRPQVLDAALQVAVERGPGAVSVAEVAERMGVTRPVVYACFATRDLLLEALLEREEQRLLAGVLAALPAEPSLDDPQRLVIEGFQALLTGVAGHADSWRIVFSAEPDPVVAERFAKARMLVTDQVARMMRPALRSWGIAEADRKLPVLVDLFMAAGESAVRTLLGSGGSWTPAELGELFGKTIYAALRGA
jgi:AcrR family transcriptional regulator